jgi:putative transposase
MASYKFELGAKLLLNKSVYEITGVQKNKTFQLTDLKSAINSYYKEVELHSFLSSGQLEFLDDSDIDLTALTTSAPLIDFQAHPQKLKDKALRKLAYVQAAMSFMEMRLSAAEKIQLINKVSKEIHDPQPPKSWITITRWLKDYINADEDVNSLVDQNYKKGNRTHRFDSNVELIVQSGIDKFLDKKRLSVKSAYKTVRLKAWDMGITKYPSYDSFRKRIKALDSYLVMERRFGVKAAEKRFRFYGLGSRPLRPLELTEIDHTPLPLICVDDEVRIPIGRPTLTSLVDKFSRMTLGFYISFSPPSILNVMECLRHAILPKAEIKNIYPNIQMDWPACGIPEAILVDNGKEFLSNDFNEICASLGIQKPRSPPRQPWYKAAVERHFRTVADKLLDDKAGKTFSNIIEKADYDPKKDAFISLSSLIEIVHTWVIDSHNNTQNSSTNATPYNLWNSKIDWYPPRMPKSMNALYVTLGKTEQRTLQHYGIEIFTLRYNSPELNQLRTKFDKKTSYKIKYNPNDISQIFVNIPDTAEYIPVPCTDYEYAHNKTEFAHNMIKKFARENLGASDIQAFMAAEARIQEIVESERLITEKVHRASKKARYLNKTQHTQNQLSMPDSKSTYAGLSDFGSNTATQIFKQRLSNQSSALPDLSDDDLDELYEDNADWQADYSLRKDDK